MKLEVGKYYRTRDGHKVYVAAIIKEPNPFTGELPSYPVYCYDGVTPHLISCTLEGKFYSSDRESVRDLVEEWRDPIKVEGWVNVYANKPADFYFSKEDADQFAIHNRLACIKVIGCETVTGGEA